MWVLCWVKSMKPWHLVCTQSLFSPLVSKDYLKQFVASPYAAAGCFTLVAHGIIWSRASHLSTTDIWGQISSCCRGPFCACV